jgi:hypothetical protein
MFTERRAVSRTDAFKLGRLVMHDRTLLVDCLVWNRSAVGAMLEIEPDTDVPQRFRLVAESLQVDRACRVNWRWGRKMGVSFVD